MHAVAAVGSKERASIVRAMTTNSVVRARIDEQTKKEAAAASAMFSMSNSRPASLCRRAKPEAANGF